MMQALLNAMRAQASLAANGEAKVRLATVSSYDEDNYCAKVLIQPEGTETGWMPVASAWVGDGWGLFAPPSIGDQVEVQYQEGSFESGFVGKRLYSDEARPLPVPSGEFWLVHKSGSFLKFRNDGNVEVHTANDLVATVTGNLNAEVQGNATATIGGSLRSESTGPTMFKAPSMLFDTLNAAFTGNVSIALSLDQGGADGTGGDARFGGKVTAKGDIKSTGGDVIAGNVSVKHHQHPTPSGNSGEPIT